MEVFCNSACRRPVSVGLAAKLWKALNTSLRAAPMPLSVVLLAFAAVELLTVWPRLACARW